MSLQIYAPDFSNRDEITNAISVQMSFYYNDIGKISVVVPITEHNAKIMKNNSIVYDTKRKVSYIIKNVKIDTKQNRITANGYTTNYILNSRVVDSNWLLNTTVEHDIYVVVNRAKRGLERFSTAPEKGYEESKETEFYGGTVLERIMPMLSSVEFGHRVNWNYRTMEHVFEIYKGEDLTTGVHAVVFSDEQGTARDLVINDDVSTFKNVAYVAAKFKYIDDYGDEDEMNLVEIVGDATGNNRYEQWVEFRGSQESGETEQQLRKRMKAYGALELKKYIERLSFNVVIDHSDLGVAYNVGDLVSCVSKRFGVRFNARVSGVKYKKDVNAETTEIVLGEPKLTAIGEVKLNG